MTTLREHLEAIRDRHRTIINGIGVECGCGEGCANPWPCADYRDAEAALKLLSDAPRASTRVGGRCFGLDGLRVIPDPLLRVSSVPDAPHDECQHEWRPSCDGSVCVKCQESDR